LCERASLIQ